VRSAFNTGGKLRKIMLKLAWLHLNLVFGLFGSDVADVGWVLGHGTLIIYNGTDKVTVYISVASFLQIFTRYSIVQSMKT